MVCVKPNIIDSKTRRGDEREARSGTVHVEQQTEKVETEGQVETSSQNFGLLPKDSAQPDLKNTETPPFRTRK